MGKKTNRTAREEKIAAIKREQQKEERLKKIIFWGGLGLVLAFIAGLVTFAIVTRPDSLDNGNVTSTEQLTPKYLATDGSYHILQDGSVDTDFEIGPIDPNKTRLQVFFDPQCPACGVVERGVGQEVEALLSEGQIDLFLTPIAFLDQTSTDGYSTRSVNALVTVAEHDPENFYPFYQSLFEEDFQPHEGARYEPVSNAALAEAARASGVSDDAAAKIEEGHYMEWVRAHSSEQMARTDLFSTGFSTPTFIAGGTMNADGTLTGGNKIALDPSNLVNSLMAGLQGAN